MLDRTHKVDLTRQDLELIEAALQTQEKILAVQTRAGTEEAETRLDALKSVMRRLQKQVPASAAVPCAYRNRITRALFC